MEVILRWKTRTRKCFENVETERLVLRRVTKNDLEDIFRIHSDPEANLYTSRGPLENIDAARAKLDVWLKDWKRNGFGYWAVIFKDDNRMNGIGGVKKIYFGNREVLNLYYNLSPEKWGRGYATEMIAKALEIAGSCLPSYPLVARVREKNISSRRVAEKAGFKRNESLDADEYLTYVLNW